MIPGFGIVVFLMYQIAGTVLADDPDKLTTELLIEAKRKQMVQVIQRMGVNSTPVLAAMEKVPRHLFVPQHMRSMAYGNHPLPIGAGQTISQPYIVAYMTEKLELQWSDKVLEIGTGSGYQAAVLAQLVSEVYTIEIIDSLGKRAKALFSEQGLSNVKVKIADGFSGWPEKGPFNAIIITAAAPKIPKPLLDQLADGGRLIAPVGESSQELILIKRQGKSFNGETLLPVIFVPMTGQVQSSR